MSYPKNSKTTNQGQTTTAQTTPTQQQHAATHTNGTHMKEPSQNHITLKNRFAFPTNDSLPDIAYPTITTLTSTTTNAQHSSISPSLTTNHSAPTLLPTYNDSPDFTFISSKNKNTTPPLHPLIRKAQQKKNLVKKEPPRTSSLNPSHHHPSLITTAYPENLDYSMDDTPVTPHTLSLPQQ